jgi:hypothetical protein
MSLSLAFCLIVAGSVMINMADYGGYKTSLVEDYNRGAPVGPQDPNLLPPSLGTPRKIPNFGPATSLSPAHTRV